MKFMSAYKEDMPELDLWEINWKSGFETVGCDSVGCDTIQNCNALAFPNIYVALKILATVPVTTCECERSISRM